MTRGTKSLLFGVHAFWLHPWFVAWGWWRLYGAPLDPRLWVAFVVHDWGYWGCERMDDERGENHVWVGARICGALFDARAPLSRRRYLARFLDWALGPGDDGDPMRDQYSYWYCLCFYHSRFIAKRYHTTPSQLCYADKMALVLTPSWLYVPMARLTGEIHEYKQDLDDGKYTVENGGGIRRIPNGVSDWTWHRHVRAEVARWVSERV